MVFLSPGAPEDEESEEKDSVNRVAAGGLIQEGSLTQEGVQRTVQKRLGFRSSLGSQRARLGTPAVQEGFQVRSPFLTISISLS